MQKLRAVHRIVMLAVGAVILYLCCTGSLLQMIDIRTIMSHVPATNENWMAMREDIFGPPDFVVISPADYTATPLPASLDFHAMLARVLPTVRKAAAGNPLRFIELRMVNGQPIAVADTKVNVIRVDPFSGAVLSSAAPPRPVRLPQSLRTKWKEIHRMDFLGNWGNPLQIITGAGLVTLMVTGVIMYWKLYKPRMRSGRPNPYWRGGSWWRTLHRTLSIVATLFLLIETLSGTWIAVEGTTVRAKNLIAAYKHTPRKPFAGAVDASSPLKDGELPAMLDATLSSERSIQPGAPIKVIRLRYFGGMPQGVVVAGDGDHTGQNVFNASTGRKVTETEPGYPVLDLPFGWQAHMYAKLIHRGDWFALPGTMLPGRFVSLFAGLSLLYLTVSGVPMYLEHWRRRRAQRAKLKISPGIAQ